MILRWSLVLAAAVIGLSAQGEWGQLQVIRQEESDGGASSRIDLGRLHARYQLVAKEISARFANARTMPVRAGEEGYDSGLPDPCGTTRRTLRPGSPLPPRFRGVTIYVVTVDRNGRVLGLPQGELPGNSVVLVSRAARLRDLSRLTPVTLLTPDLAARLGIRSARAQVRVSADGTEMAITEGGIE